MVLHTQLHPTACDSSGWAGIQTGSDRNKTKLIIRRSLSWRRRGRGTPHPVQPTPRDSSGWAGTQTGSDRKKAGLIIRRSLWWRRQDRIWQQQNRVNNPQVSMWSRREAVVLHSPSSTHSPRQFWVGWDTDRIWQHQNKVNNPQVSMVVKARPWYSTPSSTHSPRQFWLGRDTDRIWQQQNRVNNPQVSMVVKARPWYSTHSSTHSPQQFWVGQDTDRIWQQQNRVNNPQSLWWRRRGCGTTHTQLHPQAPTVLNGLGHRQDLTATKQG